MRQRKTLNRLKLRAFGKIVEEEDDVSFKKAKGPNPLSCKKKKLRLSEEKLGLAKSPETKKKRNRRKRTRIAAHVKQELFDEAAR